MKNPTLMMNDRRPVWAAVGDGAAAAGAAAPPDPAVAAAAAAAAAAPAPAPAAAKPWYEDRAWSDPALRDHLVKSGYHAGSAEEALDKALKGDMTATAKLGKAPGQLLDAPLPEQTAVDWLKANGKAFGLPEDAAKYELKLPASLPKGLPIDESLLADFKVFSHGKGLPPAVAQLAVDFFAEQQGGRFTALAAQAARAETELTGSLQKDWGAAYGANQQLAARAFQTIAAQMKLAPDQAQALSAKLNEGMGDPVLVKFFHHLAGKMGEDTLAAPRGANAPHLDLANALQRKEVILARHSGDMAVADKAGNSERKKALHAELQGLNLIIAQHGGV